MRMKVKNSEVIRGGEIIDSWPSDVGGSNASIDCVVSYAGRNYLVTTLLDMSTPVDPDFAAVKFVYVNQTKGK